MLLKINRSTLSGTTSLNSGSEDITINPQEIIAHDGAGDFTTTNGTFKVEDQGAHYIEITFPGAANATGDEVFVQLSVSGEAGADYFTETGSSTGTLVSFRGISTISSSGTILARFPYDQASNATLVSQIDEMVTQVNAIGTTSGTATTISAANIIYRNCIATRVGEDKLRLTKTNTTDPGASTVSNSGWPTPTIVNAQEEAPAVSTIESVWNAALAGQPGRLVYNYEIDSEGVLTTPLR